MHIPLRFSALQPPMATGAFVATATSWAHNLSHGIKNASIIACTWFSMQYALYLGAISLLCFILLHIVVARPVGTGRRSILQRMPLSPTLIFKITLAIATNVLHASPLTVASIFVGCSCIVSYTLSCRAFDIFASKNVPVSHVERSISALVRIPFPGRLTLFALLLLRLWVHLIHEGNLFPCHFDNEWTGPPRGCETEFWPFGRFVLVSAVILSVNFPPAVSIYHPTCKMSAIAFRSFIELEILKIVTFSSDSFWSLFENLNDAFGPGGFANWLPWRRRGLVHEPKVMNTPLKTAPVTRKNAIFTVDRCSVESSSARMPLESRVTLSSAAAAAAADSSNNKRLRIDFSKRSVPRATASKRAFVIESTRRQNNGPFSATHNILRVSESPQVSSGSNSSLNGKPAASHTSLRNEPVEQVEASASPAPAVSNDRMIQSDDNIVPKQPSCTDTSSSQRRAELESEELRHVTAQPNVHPQNGAALYLEDISPPSTVDPPVSTILQDLQLSTGVSSVSDAVIIPQLASSESGEHQRPKETRTETPYLTHDPETSKAATQEKTMQQELGNLDRLGAHGLVSPVVESMADVLLTYPGLDIGLEHELDVEAKQGPVIEKSVSPRDPLLSIDHDVAVHEAEDWVQALLDEPLIVTLSPPTQERNVQFGCYEEPETAGTSPSAYKQDITALLNDSDYFTEIEGVPVETKVQIETVDRSVIEQVDNSQCVRDQDIQASSPTVNNVDSSVTPDFPFGPPQPQPQLSSLLEPTRIVPCEVLQADCQSLSGVKEHFPTNRTPSVSEVPQELEGDILDSAPSTLFEEDVPMLALDCSSISDAMDTDQLISENYEAPSFATTLTMQTPVPHSVIQQQPPRPDINTGQLWGGFGGGTTMDIQITVTPEQQRRAEEMFARVPPVITPPLVSDAMDCASHAGEPMMTESEALLGHNEMMHLEIVVPSSSSVEPALPAQILQLLEAHTWSPSAVMEPTGSLLPVAHAPSAAPAPGSELQNPVLPIPALSSSVQNSSNMAPGSNFLGGLLISMQNAPVLDTSVRKEIGQANFLTARALVPGTSLPDSAIPEPLPSSVTPPDHASPGPETTHVQVQIQGPVCDPSPVVVQLKPAQWIELIQQIMKDSQNSQKDKSLFVWLAGLPSKRPANIPEDVFIECIMISAWLLGNRVPDTVWTTRFREAWTQYKQAGVRWEYIESEAERERRTQANRAQERARELTRYKANKDEHASGGGERELKHKSPPRVTDADIAFAAAYKKENVEGQRASRRRGRRDEESPERERDSSVDSISRRKRKCDPKLAKQLEEKNSMVVESDLAAHPAARGHSVKTATERQSEEALQIEFVSWLEDDCFKPRNEGWLLKWALNAPLSLPKKFSHFPMEYIGCMILFTVWLQDDRNNPTSDFHGDFTRFLAAKWRWDDLRRWQWEEEERTRIHNRAQEQEAARLARGLPISNR